MILSVLTLLTYFATTSLIVLQLRSTVIDTPSWYPRGTRLLWAAGLVGHFVLLLGALNHDTLGFFHAASTIGFLVALLIWMTSFNRPLETLGVVALPMAAVSALLDQLIPDTSLVRYTDTEGLELHIYISLLAYSFLALAAVQAVVLSLQNNMLRHHHPGGFVRKLPPLTHMESLLFKMILIGWLLLTLALGSGFIFLEDIFAQHQAHKTLLSIAAWNIFAVLLYGHWRWGWRGNTAIRWTIGGFIVLLVAYFGSKLALELILG